MIKLTTMTTYQKWVSKANLNRERSKIPLPKNNFQRNLLQKNQSQKNKMILLRRKLRVHIQRQEDLWNF